jgi:hypothetical protein
VGHKRQYHRRRSSLPILKVDLPQQNRAIAGPQSRSISPEAGILKTETRNFAPFGELKFSFHYESQQQQFCISLIKVEGLDAMKPKHKHRWSTYIKVQLLPRRLRKHTSHIIKHLKAPVFNEDIFFKGIMIDEVARLKIRLQVYHKNVKKTQHLFKKDECLGEVLVDLRDIHDLTWEYKLWMKLQPVVKVSF